MFQEHKLKATGQADTLRHTDLAYRLEAIPFNNLVSVRRCRVVCMFTFLFYNFHMNW